MCRILGLSFQKALSIVFSRLFSNFSVSRNHPGGSKDLEKMQVPGTSQSDLGPRKQLFKQALQLLLMQVTHRTLRKTQRYLLGLHSILGYKLNQHCSEGESICPRWTACQ